MQTVRILAETAKARVEDIGDRIAALKFCAGRIDSLTAEWAANALQEIEASVDAVVVEVSCSGYDNDEIINLVSKEDWDGLDALATSFQRLTRVIRKSSKPVVAALTGEAMDFGLEMAISATAVCAADAAMGFAVEKNGFAPMGGGLTEITLRTHGISKNVPGLDIVPFLKRVFLFLYMGKPCVGLEQATSQGVFLSGARTFQEKELMDRAKQKALFLFDQGYQPTTEDRTIQTMGTTAAAALEIMAINARHGGFISAELQALATDIAWILGGGDVPKGTQVPESQFLRCERAAFIRACQRFSGKEKTA